MWFNVFFLVYFRFTAPSCRSQQINRLNLEAFVSHLENICQTKHRRSGRAEQHLFWISHFGKMKLLSWQPSLSRGLQKLQERCLTLLTALPVTPTLKGPCQCQWGRGACEFYVMINSVFKGVFSSSYLSPGLNCSLFPGLRVAWVPPCYMRCPPEKSVRLFIHAQGKKRKRLLFFSSCFWYVLSFFAANTQRNNGKSHKLQEAYGDTVAVNI